MIPWVSGVGCRVLGVGCWVLGVGCLCGFVLCWVSGAGCLCGFVLYQVSGVRDSCLCHFLFWIRRSVRTRLGSGLESGVEVRGRD
jgi:hypothetical protein